MAEWQCRRVRTIDGGIMKRRVVVTGLGAITPIGNDVESFWSGIKAGHVGISEITRFDTTDYKVKIAAEVKDFSGKDIAQQMGISEGNVRVKMNRAKNKLKDILSNP